VPAAYRAIADLVASPKQAVPLLKARLRPTTEADLLRIPRLIGELDSDKFAMREKAVEELRRYQSVAELELRKALADKPSLEMTRRIEALLAPLRSPLLVSPDETLRTVRALQILEHVGTPEARNLLELIRTGCPQTREAREAQAALLRLEGRTKETKP